MRLHCVQISAMIAVTANLLWSLCDHFGEAFAAHTSPDWEDATNVETIHPTTNHFASNHESPDSARFDSSKKELSTYTVIHSGNCNV